MKHDSDWKRSIRVATAQVSFLSCFFGRQPFDFHSLSSVTRVTDSLSMLTLGRLIRPHVVSLEVAIILCLSPSLLSVKPVPLSIPTSFNHSSSTGGLLDYLGVTGGGLENEDPRFVQPEEIVP